MTWRLGVAGSPIEHSLTPELHDAALAMVGLEGTSRRVELGAKDKTKLNKLMRKEFDALSITMPLKAVALEICDEIDDVATRAGSVNSLLLRDGKLSGASTDGDGFVNALHGQFNASVEGAHVVVLGAGGAASAIIDGLVRAGVASVAVHARNETKVEALVSRYANVYDFSLTYRPVDVIVNATPVEGRVDEVAVMQGVSAHTIAIDITYEPRMSAWRSLHERSGCASANGLGMLAYQAALQMQWWWDVPIDGARLLKVIS
ncbi:MAG TPA: NAD(P)-binding domain-containing protein [Acidimicrobiales bacterium]|nr:NAD(P)-binding domain-containing protein [Acidimicrobiales bacterium]